MLQNLMKEKLQAYNQKAIDTIKARGYEPVIWKGKEYNLGRCRV